MGVSQSITCTAAGQMWAKAVIPVAVAAVLLVAAVVLLGPVAGPAVRSRTPPGIDEAAAERIATEVVAKQGPGTQVVDIAVERHEDQGTFWRVTLHADVIPPSWDAAQPIRIYYQIDVDKQTATPSIFAQG